MTFDAVYSFRGRGRKFALSAARSMFKMIAVSEKYSGFLFNPNLEFFLWENHLEKC